LPRYTWEPTSVRQPSFALEALEKSWPVVEGEFAEKQERLNRKISNDDPIRSPVDLLVPRNQIEDEAVHTRALA
jgi:hypothetical protein